MLFPKLFSAMWLFSNGIFRISIRVSLVNLLLIFSGMFFPHLMHNVAFRQGHLTKVVTTCYNNLTSFIGLYETDGSFLIFVLVCNGFQS